MKKLVVAIIALLYLVSASGVVVDIHYCMGDLAAVSYDKEADAGKDGCCPSKSRSKWLKLQDAHHQVKLPKQIKQISSGEATILRLAVTDKWTAAGQYYSLRFIATPEHLQDNDIYLHNRVLRI